jgi:YHS domain-containing protein
MLRWIIILIGLYLAYRIVRRIVSFKTPPGKKAPAEIQDEMVQDPMCKTYVPKRVALEGNRADGQKEYFCSAECRDNYLKLKKKSAGTEK